MRVLVCGGRNFNDRNAVYSALNEISAKKRIHEIISGMAPGADTLALDWANENMIQSHRFPADWKGHGRAAGPLRNQKMLDEGKPHFVLAFPGGRGTADMIRKAKLAGVPVIVHAQDEVAQ